MLSTTGAFIAAVVAAPALCQQVDLIGDPGQWSAGIDNGGTKMALGPTADARLAVTITADGGNEDYPKLRRTWPEPQDDRPYMRLRGRMRVTSDDEGVRDKVVAFVFYDEKTRLPDYPGNPMKQQVISHTVPVGKWVDFSDWLLNVNRSAIRQLDLYLYEQPPGGPHTYRWEFAQLQLEGVGEQATAFDTEIYAKGKLRGTPGRPAARVRTDDGLELVLGSAGGVSEVRLGKEPLGSRADRPTGLLVRDATTEDPPVMVGGKLEQRGKEVRQTARVDALGLEVDATYRSRGRYIEVAGKVADLRGRDRAVTLYLALPLAEAPWQWWQSVAVAQTEANDTTELSYLETGRAYGLSGAHSRYPLGAVTWPDHGGLSLAVRMDEPVVHRIAYNPGLRLFYLALDFGLVPEKTVDGRPLSEAPFRILLYPHDPGWGFRSVLQRYYSFFPDFFTKRVKREGGWYVWGDMSETDGAAEAGFAFHWGPRGPDAVRWDNAHDMLALLYIEPEFFQQTMGDFDRPPTPDQAIERLTKLAEGDPQELARMEKLSYSSGYAPGSWVAEHSLGEALQTIAAAAQRSVNYGADGRPYTMIGQYPWMRESKWGCVFPCNLDPGIPRGKGWFDTRVYIDYNLRDYQPPGPHMAGIGLDSFGGYGQDSRANYRREHFRYANVPLSFSAAERVPVQVAAFASVEWLRGLAAEMHGRGLVLMTNCSWGSTPAWLTFAAPYLDIFGAEATQFADPDFIRAIAYRKPCTDLPYNPRPDWEVEWHLLHDIYPGHGNKLDVMRRYAALLRDLSAAGWEPVTFARIEPAPLRIERYGSGDRIYLVAHNPGTADVQAHIRLDLVALGLKQVKASRLPSGETVPVDGQTIGIAISARATTVLLIEPR